MKKYDTDRVKLADMAVQISIQDAQKLYLQMDKTSKGMAKVIKLLKDAEAR